MGNESRSLTDLLSPKSERETSEESRELEVVELTVNDLEVPRYFAEDGSLDSRDVVLYIRRRFPNPWQKVILTTDIPVPLKYFEEIYIYVKGKNEAKVSEKRGLSSHCCCPFEVKAVNRGTGDYGTQTALAEFSSTYSLNNFEVLIYGDDLDALREVWEYTSSVGNISQPCFFPARFTDSLKLFKNGLDIAPYAERVRNAQSRNELNSTFLQGIMEELRKEVRDGRTAIQNFESTRSIYAKWLTMCLIQEFSLPPVYVSSYIAEYVGMKIAYPFEKLSFYERIMFLRSLPETVGYVGRNQEFMCLYSIAQKIFPNPEIVFDLKTGKVITEDLEQYKLQSMKIVDYRDGFPESKDYFVEKKAGLASVNQSDVQQDKLLVQQFMELTDAAADAGIDNVFLSVRNTVLANVSGHPCVVYYKEPLGLLGTLTSEYFGIKSHVIYEDEFHRLLDAKVILAIQARDAGYNISSESGGDAFNQIMLRGANTFTPAIPTFVLMCAELAGYFATDLSYYDQRLRCDKNIVPIVTHADSGLNVKRSVFSYVSLQSIRKDVIGQDVISAFGTINSVAGYKNKIPVSTDSFKGHRLL